MTEYKVVMPKLSLTMEEGLIVKWHKKTGDNVTKGEPLLDVMTDKINMEVESPFSGTLKEIFFPEGETVKVMKPVAIINGKANQEYFGFPDGIEENESVECIQKEHRIIASPLAKSYAKQNNIDLSQVKGSGPNGKIILENVKQFQKKIFHTSLMSNNSVELNNVEIISADNKKENYKKNAIEIMETKTQDIASEVSKIIRKEMAKKMTESWKNIPHVTLNMNVDITEIKRLKNAILDEFQKRVSYTDIIIKASSMAIEKFPIINSSLIDENIIKHSDINIAIAIDTPRGLLIPVIQQTQNKSLLNISQITKQLIEKARASNLTNKEVTGSTFTITNLGMFGIDTFTPIINPPEIAILGVNKIREVHCFNGRGIELRQVLTLSLSFDHRLIDGATGAKFLNKIKYFLEYPYFLNIK